MTESQSSGLVVAVSSAGAHSLSKQNREVISLRAGLGVEGDAHAGATVQHRSRVARDPTQPNLRQVHLIHSELHDQLRERGFHVRPGEIGENITTQGVDLLDLPIGTQLFIGGAAIVELTGLRNPCVQLDRFQPGLMAAVLSRTADGEVVRKSGVMGIVLSDGEVRPGDAIEVALPPDPHRPLGPV